MKLTRAKFHEIHKACPKCHNEEILQTLVGIPEDPTKDYVDNRNRAECDKCGWKGKVINLVPGASNESTGGKTSQFLFD